MLEKHSWVKKRWVQGLEFRVQGAGEAELGGEALLEQRFVATKWCSSLGASRGWRWRVQGSGLQVGGFGVASSREETQTGALVLRGWSNLAVFGFRV